METSGLRGVGSQTSLTGTGVVTDSESSQEISRIREIGGRIISGPTHINPENSDSTSSGLISRSPTLLIEPIQEALTGAALSEKRVVCEVLSTNQDGASSASPLLELPEDVMRAIFSRLPGRILSMLCTVSKYCENFLHRNQGYLLKEQLECKGKICFSDFAKLEKYEELTGKDFESDKIIELNLNGSDITDGHLEAVIKRLPNLRSLNLWECRQITDAGLASLRALRNLQSLDLSECGQITDAGLDHLRDLPNLQSLHLNLCRRITGAGLDHLKDLPNLQSLDLSQCRQITDAELSPLRALTNLQSLELNHCDQITDAGLVHLRDLPNLQSLKLGGCLRITNAGLAHLTALINLQSLDLYACNRITDAGLDHLRTLTNLQSLGLQWCQQITNAGLDHLRDLTNLQSLNLVWCDQITNAGLAPFAERGVRITRFSWQR